MSGRYTTGPELYMYKIEHTCFIKPGSSAKAVFTNLTSVEKRRAALPAVSQTHIANTDAATAVADNNDDVNHTAH